MTKDKSLSEKIKYEKERMVGVNTGGWSAIQRIEVDIKEVIEKLIEDIKQENSTNPDINAILIRGSVLQFIKNRFGEFK